MTALSVLADALYREEVVRARAMSPAEKLLEGPRLFDRAYLGHWSAAHGTAQLIAEINASVPLVQQTAHILWASQSRLLLRE